MLRKLTFRLSGVLSLVSAALTWAWMLGAYEHLIPIEGLSEADARWISPGLQTFPITLSIIQVVIGLVFVSGVVPVASQTLTGTSACEPSLQKDGLEASEDQDEEALGRP